LVEERFWERREEFLMLNPAGAVPVLVEEGQPAIPGASIIVEYIEETRGAPPRQLVQRQIPRRGQRATGERARVQALHDARTRRRAARYRSDARRAPQYPLSSRLYRLAGADARLARRRPSHLCRSCRGGAPFRGRLSGRCAVERRRGSEELVRAGEVAALVPRDSGRRAGGPAAVEKLRQPRLLISRRAWAIFSLTSRALASSFLSLPPPLWGRSTR